MFGINLCYLLIQTLMNAWIESTTTVQKTLSALTFAEHTPAVVKKASVTCPRTHSTQAESVPVSFKVGRKLQWDPG